MAEGGAACRGAVRPRAPCRRTLTSTQEGKPRGGRSSTPHPTSSQLGSDANDCCGNLSGRRLEQLLHPAARSSARGEEKGGYWARGRYQVPDPLAGEASIEVIAHQGDAKVCNRTPTSYERIVGSSGSVRRDNGGHTLGLGSCWAYASVPVRLLFPVCGTGPTTGAEPRWSRRWSVSC